MSNFGRAGRAHRFAVAAASILVGTVLTGGRAEARPPADSEICIGVGGVAPGSTAVVNITNTEADGIGYGAVRPSDDVPVYERDAADQYSSVNYAPDTPPNPNLAFSQLGADGRVCYDVALFRHHVILDLQATIPPGVVTTIEPRRILDTRSGDPLSPDSTRCVAVPGAVGGDTAVVNITNTAAASSGYGALRSSDAAPVFARPSSAQYSSVNFAANTPPNPNLAFSQVGADGRVCYDGAISQHHVILDLEAILPDDVSNTSDPRRLVDTRNGPIVAANSSRCVNVPAQPGDTVVVNITNTGAVGSGYGTLRPSGTTPVFARPRAEIFSSVNFAANTPPNPNLSFVEVGSDQRICYDGAVSAHHVILDLAATIPRSAGVTANPSRAIDTRPQPAVAAENGPYLLVDLDSRGKEIDVLGWEFDDQFPPDGNDAVAGMPIAESRWQAETADGFHVTFRNGAPGVPLDAFAAFMNDRPEPIIDELFFIRFEKGQVAELSGWTGPGSGEGINMDYCEVVEYGFGVDDEIEGDCTGPIDGGVRNIQTDLNAAGRGPIAVTGNLDASTYDAFFAFQNETSSRPTGRLDGGSLSRLRSAARNAG